MTFSATESSLWECDVPQDATRRLLKRALVVSLVAHAGLLATATWIRLPHSLEPPLASVEISLASLPMPPVQVREQPVEPPKPAPPVKAAPPVPAPAPRAAVKLPGKSSNDVMRDLLKDIQLPPDAPKLGDISPADKAVRPKLKLPEVPLVPETKELAAKPPDAAPRPSLSEDVSRELDQELNRLKKLEVPKPVRTETPTAVAPPAETPSVKKVDTAVLVPGVQAGTSPYWSRVQMLISSHWEPPPVGQAGDKLAVVIKFRLSRTGAIGFTAVEETSGNEYFDMAGKRAVMDTKKLPPFPSDMPESYIDVPMRFRVGEGAR